MSATATPIQPKAEQVYSAVRQDIVGGKMRPGSALPTQRELRERFGVADHTVSVAMGRLVQEGLVTRVRRRGSFVRKDVPPVVRVMDFVRIRRNVGLPERPSDLVWIEDFNETSRTEGYTARWHHLAESEACDPQIIAQRFADAGGIIAYAAMPDAFFWHATNRNIPLVAVFPGGNKGTPPPARHPQIVRDEHGAGRMACDHLARLGHRRIGYLGTRATPIMLQGFLDAGREHRTEVSLDWLLEISNSPSAPVEVPQVALGLLRGKDRPTAFVCATDHLAVELIRLAQAEGLNVPGDLAVVAGMDSNYATSVPVTISAVSLSRQQVCRKALRLIESMGSDRTRSAQHLYEPTIVPTRLQVRQSCGADPQTTHAGEEEEA